MENVHSFHMGRSECGEEPGESFLGRLLSPADGWMASQSGPARPGLTLLTSLRQSVTLPLRRGGRDSAPHQPPPPGAGEHEEGEESIETLAGSQEGCVDGDGWTWSVWEMGLGWVGLGWLG